MTSMGIFFRIPNCRLAAVGMSRTPSPTIIPANTPTRGGGAPPLGLVFQLVDSLVVGIDHVVAAALVAGTGVVAGLALGIGLLIHLLGSGVESLLQSVGGVLDGLQVVALGNVLQSLQLGLDVGLVGGVDLALEILQAISRRSSSFSVARISLAIS